MCLITFGKLPSEESLTNADLNNPHGIGAAWLTTRGVQYAKGLTVKELLALPANVRESVAIHFRLATVGGQTPKLLHPFPVSERVPLSATGVAPAVIFHNGHISDWEKLKKATKGRKLEGPVSDSRILARFVYNYGHRILNVLYGQRVLYISRHRSVLYGQGWKEENGTWYSNDSHKEERWGFTDSRGTEYFKRGDGWEKCATSATQAATRKYAGMSATEMEEFWKEMKEELESDVKLPQ